ncbi:MAG: 16S rRNA (cytosine(967)-C(5))-methyltransferase RsmB [Solirubrobacterales bacterium]
MSQVTPERAAAYAVLRRTFEGDEYTEAAFRDEAEKRELAGRSRSQAMRMAYGAVQRKGSVDSIISGLIKKKGQRPDPPVMAALRLGIFELLFSDGTPDHAVVDQAVNLTRESGAPYAAGFVNALLRRTLRERETVIAKLADDSTPAAAAMAHSAPVWLVEMWWKQLGPERARTVLAAANQPSERALRVNTARVSTDEILERLAAEDLELEVAEGPWPLAPPELLIARGSLSEAEKAAQEGLVVAQSRGSAAVIEVLDPQPGERILDLCAGPGIKTGQIAARVGRQGNMVSVEPNEERADDVAEQLQRLGFHNGLVLEADARHGEILSTFDRVVVDAPCSDLGALASRPDARWRKSPAVIDRVTKLQAEILDRAAEYLEPGGTLVYSTCTISSAENAEQAAAFADRSGLEPDDLGKLAPDLADAGDSRFLQLLPDRDRTTGFFISRFKKPDTPVRSG